MKRVLFTFLMIVAIATAFSDTVPALTDSAVKGVSKVNIEECSDYTTCWDCLRAAKPYCGWCSFEHKCSLPSNCQDAYIDPIHWINYKESKSCPIITTVTPHQLQRTTEKKLNLVIDNLPSLSNQYLCAFTAFERILVTNATRTNYGVNCDIPRIDLIPPIPIGQNNYNSKLSVTTTSGKDLAATNFTFFDCSSYSSCTSCVSSSFPCDWCIDAHRCTHDTADVCKNDMLINGINGVGSGDKKGPAFCPKISLAALGLSPEILVVSGSLHTIKVKVDIMDQFILQTRFACQFKIDGHVISVNAQLLENILYCDEMRFIYTRAGNTTATFAAIWGGNKSLDNPENIHVVIYRCSDMAKTCGKCLTLEKKYYRCGWCQDSESCEILEHCNVFVKLPWLHRSQNCPNPEITSFSPELGPWEGGTNITIKGSNLGKTFLDISNGISIAGINCQPYEQLYIGTKQIVCKVDGLQTSKPHHGPVVVRVNDHRGESKSNFSFVDPIITGISPKYGPQCGGTTLKITGENLNAGNNIRAFINNSPCTILSIEQNEVVCLTSASNESMCGDLRMKFDEHDRYFDGDRFFYGMDPIEDLQNNTEENSIENLQKELFLIQIKTAKAQEAAAKATELAANAIANAATAMEQLVRLLFGRLEKWFG